MAANHIKVDNTRTLPRAIQRHLQMLQEAGDGLKHALDAMTQLSDGARTDPADFDLLATEAGYSAGDYATANAAAKASYDEINSVVGTYIASLKAAVDQAVAMHGWG